MANYTKSFNFRNGVQVDDTNFVISPDGLVGIGTSQPNKSLDVYGDSRVSGIASFNHIEAVGIVTVGDNIKLNSSTGTIEATSFIGNLSGASGIVAIATAGWIQHNVGLTTMGNVGIGTTEFNNYELQVGNNPIGNVGVAITEGVLLVSGLTTTKDLFSSGVSTFFGNINADADVDIDGHTELDDVNISGFSTFSSNVDIDADIDVDGHTELDDVNVSGASTFVGVSTFNSEVSIGGSIFVAGISTFKGAIDADSDVDIDGHTELDDVNVAGVSTFNDSIVIKNGSDIKVNWDKSGNKFTFSKDVKAVFDDGDGDVSPGLEISHSGTDSLIQDYGEGNFILKTSSSTFKILGSNAESMIVANPNQDVQLYNDGTLKFNTVSTGASVYGQINVARLNGGTNTLSTKSGSLKYGNETSAYDYSTRKSFDVLNNDTGNINFYVDYANVSTADTGSFYWHKGTSSRLMALTYDGKLGIGQTLPEMELHVSGGSTVSGNSYYGGDLTVYGTLTAVGNITGNANFGYIQGNIDASSLIQSVGVSTFSEINVTQTNSILAGVGIGTTNPNDYRLDINEDDKRFFVDIDGNIGIKTDVIDDTITINALQGKATFGGVGVGTTNPQSAVDFREAGQDAEGDAANRMYMYPPKVTTAQRNALTGMTGGAFVYNTSENRLEFYQQGVGWRGLDHSA